MSPTPLPPLLVPHAPTPKKNLALLRQLGTSAPGPFFAASPAGATNAALFIAACLAPRHPKIRRALHRFRSRQTLSVPHHP
jgi:5-(carboxyamino)imidazole ribonucleotide mutase